MNAAGLARALGFKRSGNQWAGCCVAHDDKNPSMIIYEGRNGSVQVRCLAGCSSGEIVDVLRERGLWGGQNSGAISDTPQLASHKVDPDRHRLAALRIWEDALAPEGTPVQRYLAGRGLIMPDKASSIIRYHPNCPKRGEHAPALIALMRSVETFKPVAINRLFLDLDQNKKLEGMMLGPAGGAAMMITSRHDTFWAEPSFCPRLAVCEGLETGLALLMQRQRCVWALGSAGAIARLPLIFAVGHLLICADNDENGVGLRAALDCAERWNACPFQKATILMPSAMDSDFADLVRS